MTDEAQLKGLPPSAVAMARAGAESKGVAGWRFTLQGPSYVAVMTYLDDARDPGTGVACLQHPRDLRRRTITAA